MHLENDQLDDCRSWHGVYRCVLCGEISSGLKAEAEAEAEAEAGQFGAKLIILPLKNVIYRLLSINNK